MYFLPLKKITKVLFARNRGNTSVRERTPIDLNECMKAGPNNRRKSRTRWIALMLSMAALIYIMLYHTQSEMAFQSIPFVSEGIVHEKIIDRNKKVRVNESVNNGSLKAIVVAKVVPADVSDDVQKTKELTAQRAMKKNLPWCITNVTDRGELIIKKINHTTTVQTEYSMVKLGGYFYPEHCLARHKVAILIPYRDRATNLGLFLYNMHPFLMSQNLEYRIFVIEQAGKEQFNRGRLFNVGFKEMLRYNDWHCVIFHDVDLLPLDHRILYTCPTFPRHMCATVAEKQKLSYEAYHTLFGGVAAMTVEHFKKINGYSNMYWGWGAEDNDLFWRIRASRLPTVRYNKSVARYTSLPHPAQHHNPYRYRLLHDSTERIQTDGLSNLVYRVIATSLHHLQTHLLVDINPLKENITDLYYRLWHNIL